MQKSSSSKSNLRQKSSDDFINHINKTDVLYPSFRHARKEIFRRGTIQSKEHLHSSAKLGICSQMNKSCRTVVSHDGRFLTRAPILCPFRVFYIHLSLPQKSPEVFKTPGKGCAKHSYRSTRILQQEYSSTPVGILQYSYRSTRVLPREYSSTASRVLEYLR